MPPPVPVTVILCVPAGTLLPILIVMVEDPAPGAAIGLGLKVTPPIDAERVIAELKPPETVVVMVVVPEPPGAMLTVLGEALMVKLGGAEEVTVSVTVVVSMMLPAVPVTVMV